MSDNTGIEWTDATWNPVRGCSRVSEGCRNCYAERVASRFSGPGLPYEGLAANGKWTGKTRMVESAMEQPLRWKRPRRIFVNSMSDLFHETIPLSDIERVFRVMSQAHQHTFQILTKRPERMLWAVLTIYKRQGMTTPLSNVWLGVSVENQAAADERIPLLLQTPAAVHFLSCEPLLGTVFVPAWLHKVADLPRVDWVIAGGESGHGARPMHPGWVRSLRDQCAAAGVPYFLKQWGEWGLAVDHAGQETMMKLGKHSTGAVLDGREHKEFPR